MTATRSLPKTGSSLAGQQEREGVPAARQVVERDAVDRLVELAVEVVDPELVEVAEDDVRGPVGDQVNPVLERLAVVARQVAAGLLHLDEHPRLPLQVGVRGPAVVAPLDALLQRGAGLPDALVTERLEQVLQEDGGLALLVAASGTRAR